MGKFTKNNFLNTFNKIKEFFRHSLHKSLDSFVLSVEKKLKRKFEIETPYLRLLGLRKKQAKKDKLKKAKKSMD